MSHILSYAFQNHSFKVEPWIDVKLVWNMIPEREVYITY